MPVTLTDDGDLPTITRGDSPTFDITVQDDTGSAVDISGWTLWLTIKDHPGDSDAEALVQKQVSSHVDAAVGETAFTLTESDTDHVGNAVYDIQLVDNAGSVQTAVSGRVYFRPDITQSTT